MRIRRLVAASALAAALTLPLAACSTGTPLDNVVDGLVDSGVEQLQGGAEQLISDAFGGAQFTQDGSLPDAFPAEVPLVGEVRGGATAPEGQGWAAQTVFSSIDQYTEAEQALTDAGFTSTFSNADGDSAAGQFSGDGYQVFVVVGAEGEQLVATYFVTPA